MFVLALRNQNLIFQITMEAMKSDIDEVALQGIEFWSNVCDEEVDLAIELSEVKQYFSFFLYTVKFGSLVYSLFSTCVLISLESEISKRFEGVRCVVANDGKL